MRLSSRLLLAAPGMLLVASLLLAGCGSSTSNASKYGGSLYVYGSSGIPGLRNFNPFLPIYSLSGTRGMIYETLLYFNQLQGGKITPWLASGYQFSADATSVTFKLRSGVKWADGQAFTSADVVFTLNVLKRYPTLDTNGLWKVITSVSAPDAQTVVVTFNQPAAPMLWYLAGQTFIVPEHIWKNIADPTTAANPNPVGTGPFILKAFPTTIRWILARNPHYWQPGKPYIDQITYQMDYCDASDERVCVPPAWDWMGFIPPYDDKLFDQRDPTHDHHWFSSTSTYMLYLNLTKAPFNQLAVRQAISVAIDRSALSVLTEPDSGPVANPTGLVLPANQQFLAPQYQNTTFGAADPARASAILQAAGFKKGSDGVYADASGHKLEFSLSMDKDWSDWMSDSQTIAQNLNAAGMRVTVKALSFQGYISALTNGTFDAIIAGSASGPTPYYFYDSLLASTAQAGPLGTTNWEHWSDARTNQLLEQYAGTSDPTTQQQAIFGLEQIMVEQIPAIPLLNSVNYAEYSTARFVGWPDAQNPYALPSLLSTPDAEVVALNIHRV